MKIRRTRQSGCRSIGRVTAELLLSFLATTSTIPQTSASLFGSWPEVGIQVPLIPSQSDAPHVSEQSHTKARQEHQFTLRHIFFHGTYEQPNLYRRLDLRPKDDISSKRQSEDEEGHIGPFHAKSSQTSIQRLSDRRPEVISALVSEARLSGKAATPSASSWALDDVEGPDIKDKETVVSLALMAANAYVEERGTGEWEDAKGPFNYSDGFGWEGDSLRGYVFINEDNSTIVVAIKGTTPAVFDGAETTSNDKINDNLFFSCCCGQGGHYLWRQVCDCQSSAFTCNNTCLVKALREENRYYKAGLELFGNITELYPNTNKWLTGHSLGGAVCSFLGLSFGLPVTTFETPGQALAAARLGLPSPPDAHPSAPQSRHYTGDYHFGHTADPIFMGTCNAVTSACTLGGYAMETQCHTGHTCIYDTVGDFGWRVGAGWHSIRTVIRDVFKKYDKVAKCEPDLECVDCFNWKYFESNGSSPTTSSSSSSTTTTSIRTSTCKTPGTLHMSIGRVRVMLMQF